VHGLFTGRAADGRGPQKAGRTSEVFFMLRQEHAEQPARRDDPHKAAISVNDGQGRFSMANRAPYGHLLVDARRDHRGSTIHQ
jgi:hypothetical protein